VLAVGTDAQWVAAASALDLPEFSADPALATNAGRVMHRARIVAALASQIATRPAADWIRQLEAARVPCGRVRTVRDALADLPASPVSGVASAVGGTVRSAPPPLDADGETIRQFGWSV
jgi:crotonobetainyl-CoA:carnitine CoA-transferase CaiB-like acyl-CoA transferase